MDENRAQTVSGKVNGPSWMSLMKYLLPNCILLLVALGLPADCASGAEPAQAWKWERLADPPKDVAGRESPPGTDGAWVYVPEWKGFLLYGGSSPTYSNEGWFFDPDRKEWALLWPHDALTREAPDKPWRVSLPRDLVWSLDRPGPARMYGIVHDAHRKQVVLFGGHPSVDHSRHWGRDPRLTREAWLGSAKLGTWTLDPTTGKFRHLTDDGPSGITRGVYDSANRLIVAMPVRKGPYDDTPDKPGIHWEYP